MMRIRIRNGPHVMVDDLWYMYLTYWNGKWLLDDRGCVYRYENRKKVYMHRVISEAQPGEIVRFIDKNLLNCQEDNLRRIKINDK